MDNLTHRVISTVGAGLKPPVFEAAQFYFALGLADIPLAVIITQLATTASAARTRRATGFAICTTASDFFYEHGVPVLFVKILYDICGCVK
jgi:hypothetical protein